MSATKNEDTARNVPQVRREDLCGEVLQVSAGRLVDLPAERVRAVLGNIVKDGIDGMAAKARSRLYRLWGGSEAFEDHVRAASETLATLLAARSDVTLARQAWDALDMRGRLGVLQTMADFACGVCGSSGDKPLRVPRVVLGAADDTETPMLRESVVEPVRRADLLLKVHPARMGSFDEAAEDVLRQSAYQMIVPLAAAGGEESKLVADILAINASLAGYVDDKNDVARLTQPLERYTTLFSIMAMAALKRRPLAMLSPRQLPGVAPKFVM